MHKINEELALLAQEAAELAADEFYQQLLEEVYNPERFAGAWLMSDEQ